MTNQAESADSSLTVAKMMEMMASIKALAPDPIPEIRESIHAVSMEQARVYPKRKAKNASHLRRMNNKWLRRYGQIAKPAAYIIDTSALSLFGYGGTAMMVHPEIMAEVRRQIPESRSNYGIPYPLSILGDCWP
jgi:hypothetical protein